MDMRGHGLSDKPPEGHDDTKRWAEDINAIIEALSLRDPVLCGWSYGGIVMLDYIRHFGDDRIGGHHFVDAITKLGTDDAVAVISPEFLRLIPGFFSTEATESVASLEVLIRLCLAQEPAADELYLMFGVQCFRSALRASGLALPHGQQ